MDRREGWRNRESRKRRFDEDGPGGDMPWRRGPAPGQEPAFRSTTERPGRPPPVVPSGPEISGVVKWFDPAKGFGFVELEDGSGDAFLHVSVVERFGRGTPSPGAPIRVRTGRGPKGPQVAEITELGEAPVGGAPQSRRPTASAAPGQEIRGTVKWYNAQKGFGFITPETGGKDVFVHVTALGRSGLSELAPGQVVRLQVVAGKKGPEAASVSLA
jgi:CspA family cold shock protein